MAWTNISSIKASRGKSATRTMSDCINYGINPNKTDSGRLVSVHGCTPETASSQFLQTKAQYHNGGGRHLPVDKDVLLYHLKQSFKPGEISPEDANRIGYETALKFTKNNHAFVVGTHVDRGHIHNHIYFNAVQLDADRKFHDFSFSAMALRKVSDYLCLENGLSIIEKPSQRSSSREQTMQSYQVKKYAHLSNRDVLRANIDLALHKHQPKNLKEFLSVLKSDFGWSSKQRGKNISLSHNDFKQPVRLTEKSLGEGYGLSNIEAKIASQHHQTQPASSPSHDDAKIQVAHQVHQDVDTKQQSYQDDNTHQYQPQDFLTQMQSIIHAQLDAGFKNRDAINTLSYLNQQNIDTMDKLDGQLQAVQHKQDLVGDALVKVDKRIEEVNQLLVEIRNYNEGANTTDPSTLARRQAAINYFTTNGYGKSKGKPVPHPKDLQAERATLQKQRAKHSTTHKNLSSQSRELTKAKAVSISLLNNPNRDMPMPNINHGTHGR
ncbi:MAG: relaxase/mobilization nuclease domain-containing protein [Defluviitaleaceae bacterium]|nr:relaxase/mobilization nuclease domain-containing protein [Defluviitaleaceae bacterium]